MALAVNDTVKTAIAELVGPAALATPIPANKVAPEQSNIANLACLSPPFFARRVLRELRISSLLNLATARPPSPPPSRTNSMRLARVDHRPRVDGGDLLRVPRLPRVAPAQVRDALHARRFGRADARRRVLDDDTIFWIGLAERGRLQEHVRLGLALLHVFPREDAIRLEDFINIRLLEADANSIARGTGSDDLLPSSRV